MFLVERGLARSRDSAKRAIDAGLVTINGAAARKAAQKITGDEQVIYSGTEDRYVSRGALKLAHALDHFGIDPAHKRVIDLGASTGGFTQVLLERGCDHVYAIDVGTDQLHPTLKGHPQISDLSPIHAKDLRPTDLPEKADMLVCDVSFISLAKVLPVPLSFCQQGAALALLIKPQFELGRAHIGRGGLVSLSPDEVDVWLHAELMPALAAMGCRLDPPIPSPIIGGDGNREFLTAGVFHAP